MTTERLTTLQAVKDWLNIENDASDELLVRIIDATSQFVLNWLNRDSFKAADYTQNFRGNGKYSTLLRNWPILEVSSVGIAGKLITPSVLGTAGLPGPGYTISDPRKAPQSIDLYGGYYFYCGLPCQIVYRAGFETSQVVTISDQEEGDPPVTVITPVTPNNNGQWTSNVSVVRVSDGVVFTQITSGTPSTGQYLVGEWGTYTFSLADVGTSVEIFYSYAPWDVSFAVTEVIGEWFRRKDRIGLASKSLTGGVGESITFSQKDLSDVARSALQPYMNVVPL